MMSTKYITDRIPPQALDVERTVLGTMLISAEAAAIGFSFLSEECFYSMANQRVFSAMMKLFERGDPIDVITVVNKLKEMQQIDSVGGETYLAEIAESIAATANIEHYSKILRNKAVLRALIATAGELHQVCFEDDADHENALSAVQNKLFELSVRHGVVGQISTANDVMRVMQEEYGRVKAGGRVGVTSGYQILDDKIIGLCRSEVTIIAGRPGMGKTSFALCMMMRQTMRYNIPVLFFTIEMHQLGIAQRAVSIDSGVGIYGIRMANLSRDHEEMVFGAVSRISEAPLYLCDKPGITLNEIRSISKMAIRKHGVQVVYIDHTRLMGSKSRDSVERMTEISHGLKNLGKEIEIPIVPLQQISRPPKGKKISKPRLDDLRDSGAVEEDADGVIFIHREYYYTKKDEDRNLATIIVAKQRNGPIGEITLKWTPENTMFSELEEGQQGEEW